MNQLSIQVAKDFYLARFISDCDFVLLLVQSDSCELPIVGSLELLFNVVLV